MGLFRKRSARATRRAEKRRAKYEAKLLTRAERKRIKSAKRADKQVKNQQLKTLKAEEKLAQSKAEKAQRDRLSVASAKKYIKVTQTVAPVAAPALYRGATALRAMLDRKRAKRLGISQDQLTRFGGHGVRLDVRIAAITDSLATVRAKYSDDETRAFTTTMQNRLDDLSAAVRTAEHMPAVHRRRAHRAISHELVAIEADVLARLGVR